MENNGKQALLSIYTKNNIENFARELVELGYSLTSIDDETTKYLNGMGLEIEYQPKLSMGEIKNYHLMFADLYPIVDAIANNVLTDESLMRMIDISKFTLIRGAAKNHRNVIPICCPDDCDWIIKELKGAGDLSIASRRMLAGIAFGATSRYDNAIQKFLARQLVNT